VGESLSWRSMVVRVRPVAGVRTPLLIACAALSLLILALWVLSSQFQSAARSETLESARLTTAVQAAESATATPAPPVSDFTTRLPQAPATHPFLEELQRACAAHGVQLASVTLSERAATTSTLGGTEVQALLSGAYPDIKRMLNDVLARHDTAIVSRLRLRKEAAVVQAELGLQLLSRPVAAESSGGLR
jgi:hypothetical protein